MMKSIRQVLDANSTIIIVVISDKHVENPEVCGNPEAS